MWSRCFAERVRAALAGALLLAAAAGALPPGSVRAQYPNPAPPTQPETPVPGTSQERPRFSVDATVEPGAGAPVVRLDYRMARSELLFEKKPPGYHAAYEVRVVITLDKGDRQVTGEIFVRELNVRTYAETRPVGGDIIDHVEIPVPPGKYDVRVVIRDLVAERPSGTRIEIEVPAQAAGPIWFSDLSFGTVKRQVDPADPRASLELKPSRRYSDDISKMAVYSEVVDSRPFHAQDSYRIEYRVQNDLQERAFHRDTTLARREGKTPFLLRPGILSLAPGDYRFVIELKSPELPSPGRKRTPIRREKSFEVVPSVASIAADPRSTFDVLGILADEREQDQIDTLKAPQQRSAFFEQFWKVRDPSPETPENEFMDEFYRRVQYANQHFGVAMPGWKTDMGRTYIKYGEPDEVVRSPFNFDRLAEEVWYYYKDRRTFLFVDRQGFGLYELDQIRSQ